MCTFRHSSAQVFREQRTSGCENRSNSWYARSQFLQTVWQIRRLSIDHGGVTCGVWRTFEVAREQFLAATSCKPFFPIFCVPEWLNPFQRWPPRPRNKFGSTALQFWAVSCLMVNRGLKFSVDTGNSYCVPLWHRLLCA